MSDLFPVDLRSDTVTKPTPAMRRAMAECEVGDDVAREDPTVRRLEELAAERLRKEAALFVPSGTMGNVIAAMVQAPAGTEVVLGRTSHMNASEGAALARLVGAGKRPVETTRFGEFDLAGLGGSLRDGEDVHHPRQSLLCLESSHNECGGTVPGLDFLRAAEKFARARGMRVHLDGARIFNAATHLGVEAAEVASPADSVMFCLSKGLCSPVGSVLCGGRDFIEEARRARKILGGGMRQAGVLAACGIVSLTEMTGRLAEDHESCRLLAEAVAATPGLDVDLETVQTNMVYFSAAAGREATLALASRLNAGGVLCYTVGDRIRMVTHRDVSRDEVRAAIGVLREAARA